MIHSLWSIREQPWEPKWEEDFGFAAAKYPIMASEFGGFARPSSSDAQSAAAETDGKGNRSNPAYGPAIIKYLGSKGISWTIWCFDPEWGPALIRNWSYDLTPSGEFVKAALNNATK